MLWDKLDPFFDFQDSSAIAGALFEIPGGSPYVAYLDMVGRMDFGGDYVYIKESGYQLIPEPGTASLRRRPPGLDCGQKEVRAVGPVRPHLPTGITRQGVPLKTGIPQKRSRTWSS